MVQSWLGAYRKFSALVSELFRKMPRDVALVALHKVRDFAMSATEPQQATDALLIVGAASRRCPDEADRALLQPLLRMVEEDAQGLQGACFGASQCG